MSDDIKCQLVERIKSSSCFVIQDESTDFSNAVPALLLVFARYCRVNNLENLLFYKELYMEKKK